MTIPATSSALFATTIMGLSESALFITSVECFSGLGAVIVASGQTPIARLHGAYAQNGVGAQELALTVGRNLLGNTSIEPREITDLAVGSSVPQDEHTFLGTTVRNTLELDGVVRPVHLNTLCTSGAVAIAHVLEAVARRGRGFGMALGADDQSLGRIAMDNRFRDVLAEVTGQPLPMHFGLAREAAQAKHPFARFGISPRDFTEAVGLFVSRYGALPGQVTDGIVESFRDPSVGKYMWDTAAEVARLFNVTDEEAVRIAIGSHQRYWTARDHGVFDGIVVAVPDAGLTIDQNPVRGADARLVGRGRTARGVHSGSSSQMGGAGAGLILTTADVARSRQLPVQAEIVGYSFANVPPEVMGLGPIAASKGLLQYLGLSMNDMAHIELNEAFAAVVAAFIREPDFGFLAGGAQFHFPERINPWGGAIAKGHVMGAKFLEMVALGARHFELHPGDEYVLCTLCGGGGQGAAMVLRNPSFLKNTVLLSHPRGMPAFELEDAERTLLESLFRHGYLATEQNVSAIRKLRADVERRGQPPPSTEDIEAILEKNKGRSLSVSDLLEKASDFATIRFVAASTKDPKTIGKTIGVVGAGEMGHQLAMDYARAGYKVVMADVDLPTAEKGRARILETLYDSIQRGLYSAEESGQILARITASGPMDETVRAIQERGERFEMIIEAATERLDLKQRIFASLREVADPDTILATNTSSLMAGQVGADVVYHYFNPVHAMALVDGTFPAGFPREKRDRLAAIAANTRKAFLPTEADAPGALVDPFFAATYFAADLLPELEEKIRSEAPALPDPRRHAMALLDALYVEAIRGEPRPLSDVLAVPLDAGKNGDLGKSLRRGGMGLFRLVGSTGGPKPYVETARNTAPFYGKHLEAPSTLQGQLADWERGDHWNWLPPMSPFEYDEYVRTGVAALQGSLGREFVEDVRRRFHHRFWAHVTHLMGSMHDRGIVPAADPSRIDNGIGAGLGWKNTPEAWLRAQGDTSAVRAILTEQGLTVPEFLNVSHTGDLPALEAVRLHKTHEDRVAHVVVNRPRVLNAINEAAIDDLEHHANALASDEGVSLVLLEGTGKNFVAGADLDWFRARQEESARLRAAGDEAGALSELAKIHDAFAAREIKAMAALNNDRRLRVAVVQGTNVGGGVEMIAQADLVIVLEGPEGQGTKFWMPEASLGIGIGYGAHVELAKRVGVPHAKRILLTGAGATFGAREALEMGFANRVVRRDQLPQVLDEILASWEGQRDTTTKEEFIRSWTGQRPDPSGAMRALEELWADPLAVKVMALGQVPPWLEGDKKKLAEREVSKIRRGSPEAIALLNRMVDEGTACDLRQGLIHIFDTPNARGAIGGTLRGFRWPYNGEVVAAIAAIVAQRGQG